VLTYILIIALFSRFSMYKMWPLVKDVFLTMRGL
jgi:hypothetical protein